MHHEGVRIHPTAEVSSNAKVGKGSSIWHQCQVREGVTIGRKCILGKATYVDFDVCIGDNVKIQNGVSIYHGVVLEDGVFCGPHCVFTNDMRPRAINADGSPKDAEDWEIRKTHVGTGASIGANATIVCGITIGKWAMIGAGSTVTRDVPENGLVYGNPAHLRGFICACGSDAVLDNEYTGNHDGRVRLKCTKCGESINVDVISYKKLMNAEDQS